MSKKRDISLYLVDIFVAIKKIENYTKIFKNASEFRYDSLHWDATIRELEIIGESIKNILNNLSNTLKTPNYFRKIVNFRNIITHEYFGIDEVIAEHTKYKDEQIVTFLKNLKKNLTQNE